MKVIFVLPSGGGGGGSHSIVQEVLGLNRLGVSVAIATPRRNSTVFRFNYPELEAVRVSNPVYEGVDELRSVVAQYDLAIATTALSVQTLIDACDGLPVVGRPKFGYYVQDYEPLFFSPASDDWANAFASYAAVKDGLLFAKTDWLCRMVSINHGLNVKRVQASIDHAIYYPKIKQGGGAIKISAMVRPKTARRAPKRTMRVLEMISARFGDAVEISYFGCDQAELRSVGILPSAGMIGLGALSRAQVASILRESDLFLDLSDFQAFGRTGLEGMACGCVPVLPTFGGADEYAVHEENAYLIDTRSDEQAVAAVEDFLVSGGGRRADMRDKAIKTSLKYSVAAASYSELKIFADFLDVQI